MFSVRTLRALAVRRASPRLFHISSRRDALSTTPTDYTMQIMAAANAGRFPECLHYAFRMKTAGIEPDITIYNALMSLAARNASWLFAWAIFDDMLQFGVQPTATTFAHLIHAQRNRPSSNLWNAIERMHHFGVKPNASIYTSIIQGHVAQGNIEMALHHIFAMKNQNIVPELAAVQALVVFAAGSGYSRLATELASYFEKVSLRRLDDSAWLACLASSAHNLQMDGVSTCWPIVTGELNITPNEGVCLAVLNTAARHGLPDLATDVLRALKSAGIEWQEYHFAALIEAFCRNDQMKEAFVTLHIMRTNNVDPVDTTASFIIDCIKRDVDSLDSAWALIDEIHSSESGLDIDALKVVIRASIFLGDLQRAVGVYKSFSDYGLTPDLSTFTFLLDGCIIARHRQLGDLLLADLKQAKLEPDEQVYEKMIQLCLTQDTYEDAFYYLEEMKAANFVPPQSVYEALIEKCSSAEDPRGSMVLQEMRECGYEPLDNVEQGGRRPRDRN